MLWLRIYINKLPCLALIFAINCVVISASGTVLPSKQLYKEHNHQYSILNQTIAGEECKQATSWDYSPVVAPHRYDSLIYDDVPGFTRSVYERNYALITHESRVWLGNPLWHNAQTAHLISPTVGANFAMFLVEMKSNATAQPPHKTVERFVTVLDGTITLTLPKQAPLTLHANDYAYFPANHPHTITSSNGAGLLVYERQYALTTAGKAAFQYGHIDDQTVLPVEGESFILRKLLPQTPDYDFNVHVMDFQPGEYLNVKEVHYNQHGLVLLAGKGIYRLGNDWYPVQTGDAIWMAPYCVQWYAALGKGMSRYIIYKDVTLDPLHSQ